jgi:ADP-heptose:LPS heptosyltransferase
LQSASLVRQAKKIITHDTGLMHIAAAFKKEIISVWGNTVPAFGMYPYLSGHGPKGAGTIVEVNGLSCRPCSKLGFGKCPKGHFNCMNRIDEEQIVSGVKSGGH